MTRNGIDFTLTVGAKTIPLRKEDFNKLIAAYDTEKGKPRTCFDTTSAVLTTISLCQRGMSDMIWFQLTK